MKPLLLAILMLGCAPASNPVSPSYPCGPRMHSCPTGGCCLNAEVCCRDMCCAGRDDFLTATPRKTPHDD